MEVRTAKDLRTKDRTEYTLPLKLKAESPAEECPCAQGHPWKSYSLTLVYEKFNLYIGGYKLQRTNKKRAQDKANITNK